MLVVAGRHKLAATAAAHVLLPHKRQILFLSTIQLSSLQHNHQEQTKLTKLLCSHVQGRRSFASSKHPPTTSNSGGGNVMKDPSDEDRKKDNIDNNNGKRSNYTKSDNIHRIHPVKEVPSAKSEGDKPVEGKDGSALKHQKYIGSKKERLFYEKQHEKYDQHVRRRTGWQSSLQLPVVTQSKYYYYYPPSATGGRIETIRDIKSNSKDDAMSKLFSSPDMRKNSSGQSKSGRGRQVVLLPAVNAAALLDPKWYSKHSSTPRAGSAAMTHGISKSISGPDAMRRLLRGKKEFVHAVQCQLLLSSEKNKHSHHHPSRRRSQQQQPQRGHTGKTYPTNKSSKNSRDLAHRAKPFLLQGHGVPPQLFQHFVDMGNALLRDYDDATLLSFRNHNNHRRSTVEDSHPKLSQANLPDVVRIRKSDSSNCCTKWPPTSSPSTTDSETGEAAAAAAAAADWNHHMSLYLICMQRIACQLSSVLIREERIPPAEPASDEGDDDDFTSSPLLFSSTLSPDWTVDFLRGSYYDLHWHNSPYSSSPSRNGSNGHSGRTTTASKQINSAVSPVPIVEWTIGNDGFSTLGHVLIRIQGHAGHSETFGRALRGNDSQGATAQSFPLTMVFDARFRSESM